VLGAVLPVIGRCLSLDAQAKVVNGWLGTKMTLKKQTFKDETKLFRQLNALQVGVLELVAHQAPV